MQIPQWKQRAAVKQSVVLLYLGGFVGFDWAYSDISNAHYTLTCAQHTKEIPCRAKRDTPHNLWPRRKQRTCCYVFAGSQTRWCDVTRCGQITGGSGLPCFTRDAHISELVMQRYLDVLQRLLHIYVCWRPRRTAMAAVVLCSCGMTLEDSGIKCHLDHASLSGNRCCLCSRALFLEHIAGNRSHVQSSGFDSAGTE